MDAGVEIPYTLLACSARLYDKGNIERTPPIDRMILISPDGNYIKSHSFIEDKDEDIIREEILKTERLFKARGVIPRFFDGYVEAMIIADTEKYADRKKFSDNAWIRIESCAPYKNTKNVCNYVIYKKDSEELFKDLVKSFEFLWRKSKPR